ncbi:MAG: hypothetical protein ACLFVG_05550 [Candidatus Aminicenantes bacterium]
MEELEVSSWLTLDALKKAGEIKETVGDLQSGHSVSVFCLIEDDYLELFYSDAASNYIRRYEDKEEFQMAMDNRKKEEGESPYEENLSLEESFEEEENENEFDLDKE